MIQAVIGANYGDEGKGLITDYYASKNPNAIVVRYNGGAQAGHTVVTPDKKRHVFGHVGSGSFVGNPTHLSQFFISNPLMFQKEYNTLLELKVKPIVSVDPRSIVTTPYDMIINQMLEELRCSSRHGSCGMGINETVERSKNKRLLLTVLNLFNPFRVEFILDQIGTREYFKSRMLAEGITPNATIPMKYETILMNPKVKKDFIDSIKFFLDTVEIAKDRDHLSEPKDIIFEGAQGLLLDKDNSNDWPHVTSSKTGLHNIIEILRSTKRYDLDLYVTYVTRSYLTRHGTGPLLYETSPKQYWADNTNKSNPWQGTLRYAQLSQVSLAQRILTDVDTANYSLIRVCNLAVTHLDQEGCLIESSLRSNGPTRNHVSAN